VVVEEGDGIESFLLDGRGGEGMFVTIRLVAVMGLFVVVAVDVAMSMGPLLLLLDSVLDD